MSPFWSLFVVVLVVANVLGVLGLLYATARTRPNEAETTGHVWDESLVELNKPLPRWWLWLFLLSVVFGIAYAVLYPALGAYRGVLGWTSGGEVRADLASTNEKLESLYKTFRNRPLDELAHDAAALKVGRNVFAANCAACHGSDARGAPGFPNLADADWLYGGAPDTVLASVLNGRSGVMPPLGAALGPDGVPQVANYVRQLAGLPADATLAAAGKARFETMCAACHGPTGDGNPLVGAPRLNDDVWLYGGSLATIEESIRNGRNGKMPAWEALIGADRARLAAAWVYAQSHTTAPSPATAAVP